MRRKISAWRKKGKAAVDEEEALGGEIDGLCGCRRVERKMGTPGEEPWLGCWRGAFALAAAAKGARG